MRYKPMWDRGGGVCIYIYSAKETEWEQLYEHNQNVVYVAMFAMRFGLHNLRYIYINSLAVFCSSISRNAHWAFRVFALSSLHIHTPNHKNPQQKFTFLLFLIRDSWCSISHSIFFLFFFPLLIAWLAVRRGINWFSRICQIKCGKKWLLPNWMRERENLKCVGNKCSIV